jgi:hypothetical protein
MRTIKELAQEAQKMQSACNLTGLVRVFKEALVDLRANMPEASTIDLNTHPISVLYARKIAELSGCDEGFNLQQAREKIDSLVNGLSN